MWKALITKDADALDEVLSPLVALVDPSGVWAIGRDAGLGRWPDAAPCIGVAEIKLSDGVAKSISPGVELLTVRASADGRCGGRPLGDRYQSAVYVREAGQWTLVFIFDSFAG